MGSRADVEAAIREAFRGVVLGSGVSLQQAELFDDFAAFTEAELAAIPALELTDHWEALTWGDLWEAKTAHLDAEGLRYYLPALLMHLLDHYEGAEAWTIGTISALDQRDDHPRGFVALLTVEQRRAIAEYVHALPGLVRLDAGDQQIIERADRQVWSRYAAGADHDVAD